MAKRAGVSLIETLVVIAIIGAMLGLILPAVQAARRKALDLQCQNNLRQINLAIADYAETQKRLPNPAAKGMVGGWSIEILPYLDQKNLAGNIRPGTTMSSPPDFLLRPPAIFRCPMRGESGDPTPTVMEPAHYLFVPHNQRKSYSVFEAPLSVSLPWASGPEMTSAAIGSLEGPHNRGLFFASGFQGGVGYMVDGKVVR